MTVYKNEDEALVGKISKFDEDVAKDVKNSYNDDEGNILDFTEKMFYDHLQELKAKKDDLVADFQGTKTEYLNYLDNAYDYHNNGDDVDESELIIELQNFYDLSDSLLDNLSEINSISKRMKELEGNYADFSFFKNQYEEEHQI